MTGESLPGLRDSYRPLILIADDEEDILLVTVTRLEAAGYRAVTTTDGREALTALHQHRPDLILLDLHMPGIDGDEFCRTVKADPAYADIPIVLFSASICHVDDLKVRCRNLGADGYLAKPFTAADLLAAVEHGLVRRKG